VRFQETSTVISALRSRGLVWLLSIFLASAAHAQPAYPVKPIRMVNPLAAGGGLDSIARKLATKVEPDLGQTVYVDNKPGASGVIAADNVAKSAPDGYTLLFAPGSTMSILPHVMKHLPYSPADLMPVIQVGTTPFVLAVDASSPWQTLGQFIAAARAKPGTLSFGSNGNATLGHLIGVTLDRAAGIDVLHVPYKGSAPAMTDLMAGQVSAIMTDFATVRPYLQPGGRLRVLALTGAKRNAAFPDIPTFSEQGYPALEPMTGSIIVWAAARTPKPVIDRLAASFATALQSADVKTTLATFGYEPTGISSPALDELARQDSERWAKIVHDMGGITLD
jgi:tripartite-type tricarboxylate transporter receptor subunit TctC